MTNDKRPGIKLAFICTANSTRSQMSEGFAREFGSDDLIVQSAGLYATQVSSKAADVMKEIGIDISRQQSWGLKKLDDDLDYVITVCDHANEHCPNVYGRKKRIHWSITDPYDVTPSGDDILEPFRSVRDELKEKIVKFLKEEKIYKK